MIQIQGLTKEFSGRILFSDVSFSINKKEKVGLVGRNGMGKSTLFKLITGELTPDEGKVDKPKNYKIASLSQFINFTESSVLAEASLALPEEEKLSTYKVEKILMGLGFQVTDFQRSPLDFSGGFQIRINLAKCLIQNADLLLLDEPTNYLDIVSQKWLLNYLRTYPGEVILITHDREFMNKFSTHILGIHRQKVKKVKGKFQQYKERIEEEELVFEKERVNQEKKRKEIENFINKFRAKARQASLASSRAKMLEKMEVYDKLENIKDLNFKFNELPFNSKKFFSAEEIGFGYSEGNLFSGLNFSLNKNDRLAIIGKNGSGKSTLLRVLKQDLKVRSGEIKFHPQVEIGYFGQTNIEQLHPEHSIEEEILQSNDKLNHQEAKSICGAMMFGGEDASKQIKVLSGGEKARVLLGKILAKKTNLLFLDEPTHHLDQESVEVLIEKLDEFSGGVILISHNEFLINRFANKLIYFKDGNAHYLDGTYEDFLNKVGWEEVEEDVEVKKARPKNFKKLKADAVREKNIKVKPLKDELAQVEKSLENVEQELGENEKNLQELDRKDYNELLKKNHELVEQKEKLDQRYEEIFFAIEEEEMVLEEFISELEK